LKSADITQRIAALLREVDEDLVLPPERDLGGKHLTEDLYMDSLDVIKFILLAEERFGCKLPDEDIDRLGLLKVSNLAAYLSDRASG